MDDLKDALDASDEDIALKEFLDDDDAILEAFEDGTLYNTVYDLVTEMFTFASSLCKDIVEEFFLPEAIEFGKAYMDFMMLEVLIERAGLTEEEEEALDKALLALMDELEFKLGDIEGLIDEGKWEEATALIKKAKDAIWPILIDFGIVDKFDGAAVEVPTAKKTDETTINVNAVEFDGDNPGSQTVEYSVSTDEETPGEWQDELVFEELEEGEIYYVFARAKENAHYAAGEFKVGWVMYYGDADANGEIEIDDVIFTLRTIVGLEPDATLQQIANMTNSFETTIEDVDIDTAIDILRMLVGLYEESSEEPVV